VNENFGRGEHQISWPRDQADLLPLEIEMLDSLVIEIRKRRDVFDIAMPYDPRNEIGDDLSSNFSSSSVNNPYNAPCIHSVCVVVRVQQPDSLLLLQLVDQRMPLGRKRCERREGKLQVVVQ